MKRLIAKLFSFLLMCVMVFSVTCRLSENFPAVYRITGIKGEYRENNSYEVYTNRTESEKMILRLPHAGKAIRAMTEPKGFALCAALYLILLFIGRKRNTPQKENHTAVYRRSFDYDSASVEDTVSEGEAEEGMSDPDASLPDTWYTYS